MIEPDGVWDDLEELQQPSENDNNVQAAPPTGGVKRGITEITGDNGAPFEEPVKVRKIDPANEQ